MVSRAEQLELDIEELLYKPELQMYETIAMQLRLDEVELKIDGLCEDVGIADYSGCSSDYVRYAQKLCDKVDKACDD